ncbi:MAG: hypothetical protein NTV15_06010 [Candidatus Bathyarchaeota archaeon]|nr:hypothetical protein [Candidatus Bathyarchaeota archaeon]
MPAEDKAQIIIQKAFQDPISELLLNKSNLTKIQFETLVIDLLTDLISDKKLSFNEKTLYRRTIVSRGAFSRTLGQARSKVISAIYTIILLSYIGVLDSRPFEEYEILAEKLRDYISVLNDSEGSQKKRQLKRIEAELLEGITILSKPTSIKSM